MTLRDEQVYFHGNAPMNGARLFQVGTLNLLNTLPVDPGYNNRGLLAGDFFAASDYSIYFRNATTLKQLFNDQTQLVTQISDASLASIGPQKISYTSLFVTGQGLQNGMIPVLSGNKLIFTNPGNLVNFATADEINTGDSSQKAISPAGLKASRYFIEKAETSDINDLNATKYLTASTFYNSNLMRQSEIDTKTLNAPVSYSLAATFNISDNTISLGVSSVYDSMPPVSYITMFPEINVNTISIGNVTSSNGMVFSGFAKKIGSNKFTIHNTYSGALDGTGGLEINGTALTANIHMVCRQVVELPLVSIVRIKKPDGFFNNSIQGFTITNPVAPGNTVPSIAFKLPILKDQIFNTVMEVQLSSVVQQNFGFWLMLDDIDIASSVTFDMEKNAGYASSNSMAFVGGGTITGIKPGIYSGYNNATSLFTSSDITNDNAIKTLKIVYNKVTKKVSLSF